MNTPASQPGNLVRMTIFAAIYFAVFGIKCLAVNILQGNLWGWLLFILAAAGGLWFYLRQYNHEEQFFEHRQHWSLLAVFSLAVGVIVLLTLVRIGIAYLTLHHHLPVSQVQAFYSQHEKASLFWFLVVAQGLVLPAMQTYLTIGFFFNYWFRGRDLVNAVAGIIASGLLFMLLHWQASVPLLIINALLGMLLAWTYLYTQNLLVPLVFSMVNGLLLVVLL